MTPLSVVCLSGGMDSTTALTRAVHKGPALALSFDYGQRHGRQELEAAKAVADELNAQHHVIDLTTFGRLLEGSALTDPSVAVPHGHYADETMRATVVPNRNAVMANIAVGVASALKAESVVLGVHAGDHAVYPDCRPQFIDALRGCVSVALEGFFVPGIDAPFLQWSKTDIAAYAKDIGAPLHLSWSCYEGGDVHCGQCGTCVERRESFEEAGVPDPTEYAT